MSMFTPAPFELEQAASLLTRPGFYLLTRQRYESWHILRECHSYSLACDVWANSAGLAYERLLVRWSPRKGLEVLRTSQL